MSSHKSYLFRKIHMPLSGQMWFSSKPNFLNNPFPSHNNNQNTLHQRNSTHSQHQLSLTPPCNDCLRNYISVIFKSGSGKKAYHKDVSICFSLLLPFMSGRAIQAQPRVKPSRPSASSFFCLVGVILFLFLTNGYSTVKTEEKEMLPQKIRDTLIFLFLSHVHIIVY